MRRLYMAKETIGLKDLNEGIQIPESVDYDYDIFDSAPSTYVQVDAARELMLDVMASKRTFETAMFLVAHSMTTLDKFIARESDGQGPNNQEQTQPNDSQSSSNPTPIKNKGFVDKVVEGIKKAFDAMVEFFRKMWNQISKFFSWIWNSITGKNKNNDLKAKAEAIKNANMDEVVSSEDIKEEAEKANHEGKEGYEILNTIARESGEGKNLTRADLVTNAKLKLTDWPKLKRNVLDSESALPFVLNELEQGVKNEQYNMRDVGSVLQRLDKELEENTVFSNAISADELKKIITVASVEVIPISKKFIDEFSHLTTDLNHRLDAVRHSIGKSNNGEYATKAYLDHLRAIQKRYESLTRFTKSGDFIVARFNKMYDNDINKLYFIMKIKSKSVA